MVIFEIIAECPYCEERVEIPFSMVELEADDSMISICFSCPMCDQYVSGEPFESDL